MMSSFTSVVLCSHNVFCYHPVKLTPCNTGRCNHNVFYLFMRSPVDV